MPDAVLTVELETVTLPHAMQLTISICAFPPLPLHPNTPAASVTEAREVHADQMFSIRIFPLPCESPST